MEGSEEGQLTIHIFEGSEEDLPEIQNILEDSPGAAQWSERVLRESLKNAEDRFLVARLKGEVAGLIIARVVGDEAEILNLAVESRFRRMGIGKSLVAAICKNYETTRVLAVFLEVRESNRGAIAFYEELGFKQVGKRPDYYRNPAESALILAKQT